MYAVIVTGGRQYKVSPGDVIEVNRLPVEVGQMIELNTVLMIGDGAETQFGHPLVPGARVRAKVADNFRSPKIIVFKYKPKVRYRRFNTHRQDLTRLVIKNIVTGATAAEATAEEVAPAPAQAAVLAESTEVDVPTTVDVPATIQEDVETEVPGEVEVPAEADVPGAGG